MSSPESRLSALGIELGNPLAPVANFVPTVASGNLLFVSGQLPYESGRIPYVGRVGVECSLEDGKVAARLCAINVLAQVRKAIGSLDKVKRVIQVQGFVNAASGFGQQPAVINGASDLFVDIFGEAGKHSRFAIGVSSLPFDAAVEVAATFEIAT